VFAETSKFMASISSRPMLHVKWTTICLMLILEMLLGLKSKQGDITAAYVHADVEEGKKIYVEMPRGFSSSRRLVMVCAKVQELSGSISPRR